MTFLESTHAFADNAFIEPLHTSTEMKFYGEKLVNAMGTQPFIIEMLKGDIEPFIIIPSMYSNNIYAGYIEVYNKDEKRVARLIEVVKAYNEPAYKDMEDHNILDKFIEYLNSLSIDTTFVESYRSY